MSAPLPSYYFPGNDIVGPRFREAGEMVLDQFHRDGRVDAQWLGLHPREFALLWRLAAQPGERLCDQQLRTEVFRIMEGPELGAIGADIARLRGKLAAAGAGHLICTDGDGRYFLEVPPDHGLSRPAAE
ncbi:MAG: winged helix-turn-helix domain-containing protein [Erythrobacter sp.]|uniref:winged helix-turn-helix domain-containing protein n=1 Tax=Erythrobacter sp. TaxID=1042 RepID=UPI0025D3E730|nr:winged helix-turn-helix domain-containing protein [Erythrobacter sp.]MCM0000731.1 winged helix-turn-helix domain-containing protein [Erythrobacter sp.]